MLRNSQNLKNRNVFPTWRKIIFENEIKWAFDQGLWHVKSNRAEDSINLILMIVANTIIWEILKIVFDNRRALEKRNNSMRSTLFCQVLHVAVMVVTLRISYYLNNKKTIHFVLLILFIAAEELLNKNLTNNNYF